MSRKLSKIIASIALLLGFSVLLWALASLRDPEPKTTGTGHPVYEPFELPSELTFAGEKVPLDRFDVSESLDRELLSNAYFHSQTIRFIKSAPRYFSIIEPILKEYGIPDDLKYLAVAESNLNEKSVSPAGAVGLWQLLKTTAQEYGLEVNNEIDERYHIEKSTVAACKFLKSAYQRFGSWALVAAAYNAGRTFTVNQMGKQKSSSYYDLALGEETARYVFRILSLKLILSNYEAYGFKVRDDQKYPIIKSRLVDVSGSVSDWADFAEKHGISYKMLKMFNPWLRDKALVNTSKKTYQIKIPELSK